MHDKEFLMQKTTVIFKILIPFPQAQQRPCSAGSYYCKRIRNAQNPKQHKINERRHYFIL